MRRPRILLAGDHVSLLIAYRELLRHEFEIVGTSSDRQSLLATAIQLQPDIIVVDFASPSLSDINAGPELKRLIPQAKILVIVKKEDVDVTARVVCEWSSGVVLKRTARRELLDALRQLVAGKSYVTDSIAKCLQGTSIGDPVAPSHKTLTSRQREVLKLLAEGRTMKEAADTLNLTTRTVAFHKYRIMRDFGLRNNVDLLKLAIREHLASAE